MIDPALSLAFALSLAALFAATATHKLKAIGETAEVIRAYRVAPPELSFMIAPVVAVLEGAIAIGLLLPASRMAAGIAAAMMFLLYASAIAVNLKRGRLDIDCGCSFGGGGGRISAVLVVRNIALAALAALAALPVGARALNGFDIASAAGFMIASVALYLAFEAITRNFERHGGRERHA